MSENHTSLPRTEKPNPLTRGIDTWPTSKILEVMNQEDHRVAPAVAQELPNIEKAVEIVVNGLSHGGRLFYAGSGTSGRLGILDAAEIYPTFGFDKNRIIPIISGGNDAVFTAIERAEDNQEDGQRIFMTYEPRANDVVIGISASGKTPFVVGVLETAKNLGLPTIALVGDPNGPVSEFASVTISPDVGPEVISGSTRLKNGTAQKMVLNMISTASMIRLGRTYSNLMAGTYIGNKKLSARAKRILEEACGLNRDQAEKALEEAEGNLPVALVMRLCGVSPAEAKTALDDSSGSIRRAIHLLSISATDTSGYGLEDSRTGAQITVSSSTKSDDLRIGQPEQAGFDPKKLEIAFQVVGKTVGDGQGAIPGAVAVVIKNGIVLGPRCWGWAVRQPELIPMTPYTVFDMASLTKVMATTPSILILAERGELRLDDPVSMFLPEFGSGGKEEITIRDILTHTSGLPDHIRFWKQGLQGEEIIRAICNIDLDDSLARGKHVIYSDLGFIILGEVLRRITGINLAEFSRKEVFEPLGMMNTGFLPPDSVKYRIAATEYREDLDKITWGQVHDENAYALGGIAGHAGLFSTALDSARYALMWLGEGVQAQENVLGSATMLAAIKEQVNLEERRGIGWMLKSKTHSSGGDFLSDSAFGHTGFTGTSLWCDPEKNLGIILLTNRVHAGREGTQHIRLRARFANAVCAAIS